MMIPIRKNNALLRTVVANALLCMNLLHAFTINQADIQQGLTIEKSGLWQLMENVTFNSEYCFVINASDVVLDLQGYTIDGQEIGQCAVSVMADNCKILNGTIKSTADTAINLENNLGTQISNVTMQQCQQGIQITNCQYGTIQKCTVQTSNTTGIIVTDSNYTTISEITVQGSNADGLDVSGSSDGSAIAHAMVSGCGGNGLTIASNSIKLTGIVVFKNKGHGIAFEGNDIQLRGLSCSLNDGNGCLVSGQRISFAQATMAVNGQDGIQLSVRSADVKITGGICTGNTLIGINNLGATSNTATFVDVRVNKVRDLWRIINSNQ